MRAHRFAATWSLCLLAVCACSSDSRSFGPLAEPAAWRPLEGAADPFEAERPEGALCDAFGWGVEDFEGEPSFFVDTRVCDYVTVAQAPLREVRVGDTVRLRLYHFDLSAEEPAEGHVAVLFDGQVQWEQRVAIPSPAALTQASWQATQSLGARGSLQFHVHNHGPNSWSLLELSVEP